MAYIYILATVGLTVIGQILLKWRLNSIVTTLDPNSGKVILIIKALQDPIVILSLFSAFLASLFWIAAISKFDLSFAYPFVALTYAFSLIFSVALLGEQLTAYKVIGVLFILLGIFISSRTV